MENDDLEARRRDLELSLANEYHLSDKSKYDLIRRIMEVLEDAIEEDNKLDLS